MSKGKKQRKRARKRKLAQRAEILHAMRLFNTFMLAALLVLMIIDAAGKSGLGATASAATPIVAQALLPTG